MSAHTVEQCLKKKMNQNLVLPAQEVVQAQEAPVVLVALAVAVHLVAAEWPGLLRMGAPGVGSGEEEPGVLTESPGWHHHESWKFFGKFSS